MAFDTLNEPPKTAQGGVLLLEPSGSARRHRLLKMRILLCIYNRVVMRSGAELKEAVVAVTRWPDLGMPAGSHVVCTTEERRLLPVLLSTLYVQFLIKLRRDPAARILVYETAL